jgi:hypothetical protein
MKLTELTSADLRKITNLLKRKENLKAQIVRLDSRLAAFEEGAPVKRRAGRRRRGRKARVKWTPKFGPLAKLDFPGSARHETEQYYENETQEVQWSLQG